MTSLRSASLLRMTAYVLAQLRFTDRTTYERYAGRFMPVLYKFNGKLLCNDLLPQVLEGDWSFDKAVLFSFENADKAHSFLQSPDYLSIAVDRKAGAEAVVVLLRGSQEANASQKQSVQAATDHQISR